jgi:hypothetical protein
VNPAQGGGSRAGIRDSLLPVDYALFFSQQWSRVLNRWTMNATIEQRIETAGGCAGKASFEHAPPVITLLFLVFPSCVPPPEAEMTLSNVPAAAARIDAVLAAVTVEPASRDRAVNPLPPTLSPLLPIWQAALQDAVARQAIFRSDAPRRLSLIVKVLDFSVSGDTLTLFARYQLFDNPAGDPVFSTDIMTNAPLSTGEDATSAIRNRTQATRAIQANITQFLDQPSAFARQPRTGSMPSNSF